MYVCVPLVSGALRVQERVSDFLELELQMIVSQCLFGAGNQNHSALEEQQVLLTHESASVLWSLIS